VLLGIVKPDPGSEVELDGRPLAGETKARSRDQVRAVQIVFQNSALNRRHSVRRLVGRRCSSCPASAAVRGRRGCSS
jgi:peptide/nickel transport system ATP-binding protein